MSVAGLSRILFLLVTAAAAQTTDTAVRELFLKARAKVLLNIDKTPRYTCVENVVRTQYVLPRRATGASCAWLIRTRPEHPLPSNMIWRDRLRVDVAVVEGNEMFSWAGAGKFETDNMETLVGTGSTGSGDFISFLTSVFGDGPDVIKYLGLENNAARFDYNVPLEKSHYHYHTRGPEKKISYGGSFFVDPSDGELQRLIVETALFPEGETACRATDEMTYHTVKIGNGDFVLPEISTMDVVFQSGSESRNETRYSDCKEYVGESTIRYDDVETPASAAAAHAALQTLPSGLKLQIGLSSPVDGKTASAGDAITGVVLRDVKGKDGNVLVHKNDHVRGRIVRLEQVFLPLPRWTFGVRFDTIEHGGVEQPVALRSSEDGEFHFPGRGGLALDEKFHSVWETR
jgi:hypothetical protein